MLELFAGGRAITSAMQDNNLCTIPFDWLISKNMDINEACGYALACWLVARLKHNGLLWTGS